MLGKLIKYEFKATSRFMLLMYGLLIALSGIISISLRFNLDEVFAGIAEEFQLGSLILGVFMFIIITIFVVLNVTVMYDVNASYEQNLGGIGYIIAHEITHAFDNNGAKFDADGNATDWWTEEDYAAFNERCEALARFYDGQEAIPGVPMNGTLTLSENVADNGAVSCITEIVI